MFSNKSPAVRQASIIARSSVESVSLASVSARCQRYGARSPMSRDAETDAVEAVKQLSLLESTLLRHRTLTIFGEINKDVAQRTAEKLLAVAFERDDPIT